MNLIRKLFQSSLGKKYVMAVSGILLFGFVIGHMLGNLQIFLGADAINSYAALLQSKPSLLWVARIGLLCLVGLHIFSAIQLSLEAKRARPVPYGDNQPISATYASRTMLMSGLIVLSFIIYHLLHFTAAVPEVNLLKSAADFPNANFLELRDAHGHHDVFRMLILGFSNVWVSGFYILGTALLCLHLSHGISSLFQSLGLKQRCCGKIIDRFAIACAVVIFIGNSSIPIAVLLGYGS